jgi:NAD(P)H-quinone oxidoreductase subunit 5
MPNLQAFFHVDGLSLLLIGLVAFVGLCIAAFAARYLRGDCGQRRFYLLLTALCATIMVLVSADRLWLLLAAWGMSNLLLVRLMVHESGWGAARAAGRLAGRNFLLGFALLAAALGLLYLGSGQASIQAILQDPGSTALLTPALLLMLGAAMTQSAIWPFHRWLTSSLNSPTPVSALMHAGLINGGGFLLARFAPLYLDSSMLLAILFVAGIATALIGTLWKLMQHDIKRMLASSTMAQMGFMLAQCGLGLFPAAVVHLVWHGLFKAYLFLASGSAAKERRLDLDYPPGPFALALALACGALGSVAFAAASGRGWLPADGSLVLVAVAFIGGAQFALTLLRRRPLLMLPAAAGLTAALGAAYGASVHGVELLLAPAVPAQPAALAPWHWAAIALLLSAWLAMLFLQRPGGRSRLPRWVLRLYVPMLNASQPAPATVTAQRNHYNHL